MIDHSTDDRPSSWRRYLPLAGLLAVAALTYAMGWHRYLTFETVAMHSAALQEFVAQHYVLALLCYSLAYVAAVSLSVPVGAFFSILGGFLFGWLAGGTVAVLSATLGATLVFLIARTSFGDLLSQRAGPFLQRLSAGFREDAMSYLLFLRLVPAFPFWLVNLAPALLGVPLRTYVVATFIGIIPATFAFAVVGAGLSSAIGDRSLNRGVVAAIVALAFVALIPVIARKLKERP